MKIKIIILVMLAIYPLSAQWQPNGNNMKLNTGSDKVRDYVLTEDGKFIYTLSDSGIISKWDAQTGMQIFRHKIIPDSTRQLTANWLFLSSDGKTYSVAYSPLVNDETFEFIYIYNIDQGEVADSIGVPFKYISSNFTKINFEYHTIDYDYSSQELISSYYYDYQNYPPYWGGATGFWGRYRKINDGWESMSYKTLYPYSFLLSHNKNYLYLNYSTSNYSDRPIVDHNSITATEFFDLNLNNEFYIAYYSYKSETGENPNNHPKYPIKINSVIFSNDDKILQVNYKNTFYQFTTDPFDTIQTKSIEYSSKNDYGEFNTPLNDYFILFDFNSIDLVDFDRLITHRKFPVDSCSQIKKLLYTADSLYLIVNDQSGSLFKIDCGNLFSLYANFSSNDTTFILRDTAKFKNISFLHSDSLLWDFGDGTYSKDQNPRHIYTDTGDFDVSLTVYLSGKKNTTLKKDYIHILPNVEPDFVFSITDTNKMSVNFQNKTNGIIDSLIWDFGDNNNDSTENPSHTFLKYCKYNVKLTVYSKSVLKSVIKVIDLSQWATDLDINKFPYEFNDTLHYNSIALKGYTDIGDYLVYQIVSDSSTFHGAYVNNNLKWEKNLDHQNDFLIKRNSNHYTYLHGSLIESFDKSGEMNHQESCIDTKYILNINSNKTNIAVSYFNNTANILCFDTNNVPVFTHNLRLSGMYEGDYIKLVVDNIIALISNDEWDYVLSYYQNIFFPTDNKYYNISQTICDFYMTYQYYVPRDMVRLNDSILAIAGNNFIKIRTAYGFKFDTTSKLPSINYYRDSSYFPGYSFKSLLRISDTSFAVAGSYKNSPAVLILNDHGAVLDSVTLSDRFGEFEFVSDTPDSMLLLSGYRYATYGVKSPYFVKFNYKSVPVDTSSIDNHPQDTTKNELPNISVYPNPTLGTATFSFSLDKAGDVSLMIYDAFGNLMHDETKNFSGGDNSFTVDFTTFSTGMFYYKLQNSSGTKYGTVVFLR